MTYSSDPKLEREIREVLLRLRLLSNAPASRFPNSIAHQPRQQSRVRDESGRMDPRSTLSANPRRHQESRPPSMPPPDYDFWLRKFEEARGNEEKLRLTFFGAREAALRAVKAPDFFGKDDKPELGEQKTKRIVEEHIGQSPEEVAAKFGCSPAHVRAARARYAPGGERDPRHPETGERREDGRLGLVEQARELRAQGRSVRVIAMLLSVPKSTVHDWLDANGGKQAA